MDCNVRVRLPSRAENQMGGSMLIAFWIMMGIIVAMIAGSKGKSAGAWFVYGVLVWPIALVHILVTPADAKTIQTVH
jgi:hypothetical protein